DRLVAAAATGSDLADTKVAGEVEGVIATHGVLHDLNRTLFGIGDGAGNYFSSYYFNCCRCTLRSTKRALVPTKLGRVTDIVSASRTQIVDCLVTAATGSGDLADAKVAGEVEGVIATNSVLHDLNRTFFGVGEGTGNYFTSVQVD